MNYIKMIWGIKDQLSIRLVFIGYFIFILVNSHIFINNLNDFSSHILNDGSKNYLSFILLLPTTFIFYSLSIGILIRFINYMLYYINKLIS